MMPIRVPLDPGEYVLMIKDKGEHNLIVTNKRLFTEKDGVVTPVQKAKP